MCSAAVRIPGGAGSDGATDRAGTGGIPFTTVYQYLGVIIGTAAGYLEECERDIEEGSTCTKCAQMQGSVGLKPTGRGV